MTTAAVYRQKMRFYNAYLSMCTRRWR